MLKFYYKLRTFNIPSYFVKCLETIVRQTSYNTRFQNELHLPHLRILHDYGKRGIHYNLIKITNEMPRNVMSKVFTHSLSGFSNYAKDTILDQYSLTCQIVNCYVCTTQYTLCTNQLRCVKKKKLGGEKYEFMYDLLYLNLVAIRQRSIQIIEWSPYTMFILFAK